MSEVDVSWQDINAAEKLLEDTMQADYYRLRGRLRGIKRRRKLDNRAARLIEQINASVARREQRDALNITLDWPDLPVVESLPELEAALTEHQVIVVAGETGSGKTTQLPKLCLKLGRGRKGYIGHTQPRRIAARAVANRIAEELGSQVGELVGLKVRFQEQLGPNSLVKLMTDGILLAEIQHDPWLNQYDTLIIDEAHERSLNIDFLLGYLRQLLPKRPDLKVIITSATIDHEGFAKHFNQAPVVEVSGRTYPVEVKYWYHEDSDGERDWCRDVADILEDIERNERGQLPSARDVLVFLSGEREIRELHHYLKRCDFRHTEFLPLYARLSRSEQMRVFSSHSGRRVVLSTNVAETSLTVPGIRYVIDLGTARISRYSVHSKVQRLPVEPISQASADQRKGRSGRIMPGVCYRLYSEEDYLSRPEYTDAEIQRTNLAAVILQMEDLRLGDIESFPFIDPPDGRLVRDGYRLLEELGAIEQRQLTPMGKKLARFPLDPRLGRMLLRAGELACLQEVLVIVSALAVQDPRERPVEFQQQADQAHQPWKNKESDFLSFLNLWQWAEAERQTHSRNQYEKLLRKRFLAPNRMREWRDTHRQLKLLCQELKIPSSTSEATYEAIHRALLSGLLGQVIRRTDEGEWLSSRHRKPVIWPGSALAKTKANWLFAAEMVETQRLFARCVAQVEPHWVEAEGKHLLKHSYSEPFWSKRHGAAFAREQVSLFGLVLVSGRRVPFSHQDPEQARELLIREGLVAGELPRTPTFVQHNKQLIAELEEYEHKQRRRDFIADDEVLYQFYHQRIPLDAISLNHLNAWYRKASKSEQASLLMERQDILVKDAPASLSTDFPDRLLVGEWQLPLEYSFNPQGKGDGVTVTIPATLINQAPEELFEWLVPGLLAEKLEALIRGLPRAKRRNFVPVPEYVRAVQDTLNPVNGPLLAQLSQALERMTGVRIALEEWEAVELPEHLRFHFKILSDGEVLAQGQDLAELKQRFAGKAVQAIHQQAPKQSIERGTRWVFGTLEEVVEQEQDGVMLRAWPALFDVGNQVEKRLFHRQDEALWQHQWGVARLLLNALGPQVHMLEKFRNNLPGFQKLMAEKSGFARTAANHALLKFARVHFIREAPPVSEQAFDALLTAHKSTFVEAGEAWLTKASQLLEAYRSIQRRLEKNFPLALAHAHGDIRKQLEHLFFPEAWQAVEEAQWQHYSRYIKAIEHRLDKIGANVPRDKQMTAELNTLWEALERRMGREPYWLWPTHWQAYRWQLEEYRVNLFAQQLGTPKPVSAKRLREQWQHCEQI